MVNLTSTVTFAISVARCAASALSKPAEDVLQTSRQPSPVNYAQEQWLRGL
jgi:hypothetical protein